MSAKPVARATDSHVCPAKSPQAHIGGVFLTSSANVSVNGVGATRFGDLLACSCAIDAVTRGSSTVSVNGRLLARQDDACVEGSVTGGSGNVVAGGEAAKPCIDWILENYQVEDDEIVDWELKILGRTVRGPVSITETEAGMLDDLGWRSLYRFNDLQKEARKEAAERYPESTLEDGHGDAFRHAYWNALGAKHMGPKWMEQFGTAHEGRPGNQATREAMDLYNNEVGRRIAAHNPDASDDELADLIEAAIENGELLVIDSKGNLAWSDQVALDETGRAESSAPIAPAIDTPDGDAKAEY